MSIIRVLAIRLVQKLARKNKAKSVSKTQILERRFIKNAMFILFTDGLE
jgi:hypothetical protein